MARTARICNKTGCPEIVIGDTYCPEHKMHGWGNSKRNTKNPPGWARTRQAILFRDNNTCQYCGAPATEIDHIKPVSQGGTHAPNNLKASCKNCNASKNHAERIGRPWTPPNSHSHR